jgi:hypothetical protein
MNIENTIFYMWVIWYFYAYGPPPLINHFFMKFYFIIDKFMIKYNNLLYPDIWETSSDSSSDSSDTASEVNDVKEEYTPPPKYEYKYLDIIRQLNKEWQFTEDENKEKEVLRQDFYQAAVKNIQNDIDDLHQQVNNYKKEIEDDTDIVNYIENCNDDGDELIDETTLEERNEFRREQINELTEKIDELTNKINSDEGLNELKSDAEEEAKLYIINKRIEKLKNCYTMEKTPQGNVLMIYDKERESFKYYSDSTIPYRYLEVVGRKYVKMFNCRPLFIDMEEELKLFEEKWTKEYELKKAKEAEQKLKAEEAAKNNKPSEQKKNIFAKFKSYNKDAGGKISMAAPPKNSIPNKATVETKEGEKILLKERANRYTYEGKFVNFNFLQKIERTVFNKKLGISFADFKKMKK